MTPIAINPIELKPLPAGKEPADQLTRGRRPEWLRVRMPDSPGYQQIKHMMRGHGLHTVCEEAMCPNIGECWVEARRPSC